MGFKRFWNGFKEGFEVSHGLISSENDDQPVVMYLANLAVDRALVADQEQPNSDPDEQIRDTSEPA